MVAEVCPYLYPDEVFSMVPLEVHFIIHGLEVRIAAKFILYKLRLFTGCKVRIEKTMFKVLKTAHIFHYVSVFINIFATF